jgi:DNA polymerase-3 subunit gamma/tau
VKFILATTDPQRLPVTILSRCLQFNLKPLSPPMIAGHLKHVLEAEKVPFEEPALALIGKAAGGSVRDSLSLLDQAIAHGGGKVEAAPVAEMLASLGGRPRVAVARAHRGG